jgi:Xaa-Pro aminopeptidase
LHRDKVICILREGKLTDSVIYMPSPPVPRESFTGQELPFVQEGIFFWLTGWERPSSGVIIDVRNNRTILLTPEYGEEYEIWHGPLPTSEEIIYSTGVDEVLQGATHADVLQSLHKRLHSKYRLLAFPFNPSLACDDLGTLVRAVSIARRSKFDHEILTLRRAAKISSDALVKVMQFCQPGIPEKVLEAAFFFHGTIFGGRGVSFPTTAASGKHAAYLHYSENSDICHDGDLVLFDCGLYVDHYAGDITRTFPVNGQFSPDQRLVYSALLRAQLALIELVRPGVTLIDLDAAQFVHIFEVLRHVGVVGTDAEYDIKVASLFCPHSLSHHIGASVHDWSWFDGPCLLTDDPHKAFSLVPNMVISIEPGIYFNSASLLRAQTDPAFAIVNFERALELAVSVCAVRIEDDILVLRDGREVLTTCPKAVDAIEEIMRKGG